MKRSGLIRAAVAAITAVVLWTPGLAQRAGDHWVVTWSTAGVGRPQIPGTWRRRPRRRRLRSCTSTTRRCGKSSTPASAAHSPPGVEQCVRHGAADHRRCARRTARQRRRHRPGIGPRAHVQRPADDRDSCRRHADQRSGGTRRPGRGRPRYRSLLPVNTDASLAADHAQRRTADELRDGNRQPCGQADAAGVATMQSWFGLARVEVMAPVAVGTVVAFGDSITDGSRSTADTNSRWPDVLARRLAAQGLAARRRQQRHRRKPRPQRGRLQAGINALARFDRDALDVPGVKHVIVLEGINDIGNARQNPTPTAGGSHRRPQAADRARARAGHQHLRRHADAVRRRRVLHAGRRSQAAGAERLDPHEPRLRRRRRFRRRDARSRTSGAVPGAVRLRRPPAPERRRLQGDGRGHRPLDVQGGRRQSREAPAGRSFQICNSAGLQACGYL